MRGTQENAIALGCMMDDSIRQAALVYNDRIIAVVRHKMKADLLAAIDTIRQAAQQLQMETDLSFSQERMVRAIGAEAVALHDLVLALPDAEPTNVRAVVSYEARSHLASIIGYAETLLQEPDDPLNEQQHEHASRIAWGGKAILNHLGSLEGED